MPFAVECFELSNRLAKFKLSVQVSNIKVMHSELVEDVFIISVDFSLFLCCCVCECNR